MATREDFNETLPLEPEGPPQQRAAAAAGSEEPALPGPGAASFLERVGCTVAPGGSRYQLREQLGVGSTGRVWSAIDRDLDRAVAIKVLSAGSRTAPEDIRGFVDEARITAALQHPNVVPVHELGVTVDGVPYFSMGKISGRSLGDLLRAATPGARDRRIAQPNAVVTIFIGILHALEYAHAQRIVHQDVKPDNVVLGDFGEVLLLDWGSAVRLGEDGAARDGLYGTPLYMSPEQARRERADRRSDVYCVGASLLHALILREPMWSDDPEEFWRRKREGSIDAPTAAEAAWAPPALLAIALKALSPDPERRYHSAATMRADLERYQAGLAVTARRESAPEALLRWYRNNRALAWTAAVSAAAIALIALGLLVEKSKETARWTLAYSADFDRDLDLSRDWTCWAQEITDPRPRELAEFGRYWRVTGGALVGAFGTGYADLAFRRPLLGDLRVEWDYANLAKRTDYNCFIDGGSRANGYTFHVGGWTYPRYCRLSTGDAENVCDENLEVPELPEGTTHHFVMERIGATLRLEIDGRTIISYHRADGVGASDSDTFGFDACYGSVLRISKLRVWHRPPAELISPLALGDKLLARGDAAGARRQYEEIANSYGGDLGRAAAFKAALAAVRAGDERGGLAALDRAEREHPDDPMMPYALYERLRVAHARDDEPAARELLRRLAAYRGHPVLRTVFYDEVHRAVARLTEEMPWGIDKPAARVDLVADVDAAYRAMRRLAEEYGLKTPMIAFTTGLCPLLRASDHSDYVARTFVDDEMAQINALADMGRYEEIVAGYGGHGFDYRIGDALLCMGRFEEVAAGPYAPLQIDAALAELGRPPRTPDPAGPLSLIPQDENLAGVLREAKRYDELIARYPGSWQADQALVELGRYDEVLAQTSDFLNAYRVAVGMLLHDREREGLALLDRLGPAAIPDQKDESLLLARFFLPVIVAAGARDGRAEELLAELMRRHRWTFGQRVWHLAAFAAGRLDEAGFRKQPYRRWLPLYWQMAQALRSAVLGDREREVAAWQAIVQPLANRPLTVLDHELIRWRLQKLGAPSEP